MDPKVESMSYRAASGTYFRSSLVHKGLWRGISSLDRILGLWWGLSALIELGYAVPFANIDPGLKILNRSVLDAKETPIGCFCYKVNDEMYSVGGSMAQSLGVIDGGTLFLVVCIFKYSKLIQTLSSQIIFNN